jgi:hypothetical protein
MPHRDLSAEQSFQKAADQGQEIQFQIFRLAIRSSARGAQVAVNLFKLQVFLFLFEFQLRVFQLLLFVIKIASGFHPFKYLPQLAAIEPQSVIPAFIGDHAAPGTEVDAVHQFFANRAIDIAHRIFTAAFDVLDFIKALAVNFIDMGDRFVQEGLQFTGIEEQTQAAFTAFDIKFPNLKSMTCRGRWQRGQMRSDDGFSIV